MVYSIDYNRIHRVSVQVSVILLDKTQNAVGVFLVFFVTDSQQNLEKGVSLKDTNNTTALFV